MHIPKRLQRWFFTLLFCVAMMMLSTMGIHSNNTLQAQETSTIRINEIFPTDTDDQHGHFEWVELYHDSDDTVVLHEWALQCTSSDGTQHSHVFESEDFIAGKAFFVQLLSRGFLPDAGATVTLRDASGNIIDEVTYPAVSHSESYAWMAEYNTWMVTDSPSLDQTNTVPTPTTVPSSTPTPEMVVWQEPDGGMVDGDDDSSVAVMDVAVHDATEPKPTHYVPIWLMEPVATSTSCYVYQGVGSVVRDTHDELPTATTQATHSYSVAQNLPFSMGNNTGNNMVSLQHNESTFANKNSRFWFFLLMGVPLVLSGLLIIVYALLQEYGIPKYLQPQPNQPNQPNQLPPINTSAEVNNKVN